MKWQKMLFVSCLYLVSVLPNAFGAEKPEEVRESSSYAIVSTDGSGAPNTVISSPDTDTSIFEKADGFTDDQKPIKNGADGFTADHRPTKKDSDK